MLDKITTCEVCGSTSLLPVLDLGAHPLCDDLVPVGRQETCAEYPIQISFCDGCATAHQLIQVEKNTLFPRTYHYRSRFTKDVLLGMDTFVESVGESLGSLQNLKVLDVGCNDGSLLKKFANKGAECFGVEPTGAAEDAKKADELVIYNDYFTTELANKIRQDHGAMDVITFTNVFAHIENLPSLLSACKAVLTKRGTLVIENHYLGSVFDKNQFDTFYHEHPRTYSLHSFKKIADSIEGTITQFEFPKRYGGNIRVIISLDSERNEAKGLEAYITENESGFISKFKELSDFSITWQKNMSILLEKLVEKHGPLAAKAFPGRAAILVKLLGLDVDQIACVHEQPGSMKIGHYLPGTRIPIVSDDDHENTVENNPILINFAWHINDEIEKYLRQRGFEGELLPILEC